MVAVTKEYNLILPDHEGLQLKGSNVHVGIELHTGNGGHLIYRFPKADFTF